MRRFYQVDRVPGGPVGHVKQRERERESTRVGHEIVEMAQSIRKPRKYGLGRILKPSVVYYTTATATFRSSARCTRPHPLTRAALPCRR
jgi:hypothetical protein